jgi:GDP-L-fucose synthase
MKIFLTGGSGMVGRNFLENAKANNYQIFSPNSSELDLLDYYKVYDKIKKIMPDMIIHAAGRVGGIQANLNNPYDFLVDNTKMGFNIVGAADSIGIPHLLNLGSSCMYPRASKNPITEDSILKGELEPTNEGYAIAKIAVARLCEYKSRSNKDRSYKTIIPCNLYGRFDKFDLVLAHMIPAVIRKLHEAKISNLKTVSIWGDGNARREFMYASDFADFLYFSFEHFADLPQYLNVGFGLDYSISEYYQVIADVVGYSGQFKYDLSKPMGMQKKLVDSSLVNHIGWKPKRSLAYGIDRTYEFYKRNLKDEL